MTVGYSFRDALTGNDLSIIAEVKRRSPSRGDLRPDAQARELAKAYEAGGATCLSVLTDGPRFGGSPADVREARSAASVPILRKDFLSCAQDVYETRDMGADALLLIVADIGVEQARAMQDLAISLGIDVVTEVRNEQELIAAAEWGAYMIMVNQRNDPKDSAFTVDYDTATRVSRLFDEIDEGIVKIAASGIGVPSGTTIADVAAAGYDAALIGEALVTADDPAEAVRRFTPERS